MSSAIWSKINTLQFVNPAILNYIPCISPGILTKVSSVLSLNIKSARLNFFLAGAAGAADAGAVAAAGLGASA